MTRLIRRRRRGFTLVELLVVILLAMVALAFLLPTLHHSRYSDRGGSNRVKCASNLRQIGQAILLYSNENKGAYPRLAGGKGAVVTPTWGTGATASNPWASDGPAPTDVSAALFLLLRTQDITPEVFVCPSSNGEKDDFGGGTNCALNRSNFSDVKKNLSYSYQNPYPNDGAVERGWKLDNNTIAPEYAVAADINPGTAGTDQNVLAITLTSSAKDMKQGNTPNHEGDGQNVLYGDGHVEWVQNAFVGHDRDHIYTAVDQSGRQSILASPYDAKDSILLPTDD
jgi:prepilin-type N-terminal cleavage/methylation domain-containing protein/prepilin-type processing-associated H-X9-DG protein